MRSLICCLLLLTACQSKAPRKEVLVDDTQHDPVSVVAASDTKAADQLLRGFFDLEGGAWRWTLPKFAVSLRTPPGAKKDGALLRGELVLPEPVFKKTGPIKVTAQLNGKPIGHYTLTVVGPNNFAVPVPAAVFTTDVQTYELVLDKWLPAGEIDPRELGLIFVSLGLYSL
jgi:hypothetical protein